jgi:hypothetical protein
MGRTQIVEVKNIREDQVVEVTAVAGNENHRLALDALRDTAQPREFEPVDEPRPNTGR